MSQPTPCPFRYMKELHSAARYPSFTSLDKAAQALKVTVLLKNFSSLPSFNPADEEEFENWFDQYSMMASRFRICPEVGLNYFLSINDTVSSMVQEIPAELMNDYEAFTDALALKMFPNSRYHRRLRNMMTNPQREPTIRAAGLRFRNITCRYIRITSRRGLQPAVTDAILPDLYLEMIPAAVQREVLMQLGYCNDVKTLMDKAEQVSATIDEHAYPAMPALDMEAINRAAAAMGHGQPRPNRGFKKVPDSYRCFGCGEAHLRRECPHYNARCANCNELGHTSKMCRSKVEKDEAGRIRARVTSKAGSTEVKITKDATINDQVTTASGVLSSIAKRASKASEARKARYRFKNPVKSLPVNHPIMTATPEIQEAFSQVSDWLNQSKRVDTDYGYSPSD